MRNHQRSEASLKQGLMTKADAHAELSEVIAGRKLGRENSEEVIVFDSTGISLQDVVAAIVYEKPSLLIAASCWTSPSE
jgi:ornithine cyclodeaminase/alanine dehydrogenase-like protein (mu-crystallin family)